MTTRIAAILASIVLIAFGMQKLQAQGMFDKKWNAEQTEMFFIEAHPVVINADTVGICVLFRFAFDRITFIRNNANRTGGEFVSMPFMAVECRDTQNIIRARSTWADTVTANSFEQTASTTEMVRGSIVLPVPRGAYIVSVVFGDQNNPQKRKGKLPQIFVNPAQNGLPFDVLFATPAPNTQQEKVLPFILNNGIPFGPNSARIIAPVLGGAAGDVYTYLISKKIAKGGDVWGYEGEYSGQVSASNAALLAFSAGNGNANISYSNENQHAGVQQHLLDFQISLATFSPGVYRLVFYKQNRRDSIESVLQVGWETMPASLSVAQIAVDAMYHILTDEEFDYMRAGSDAEVQRRVVEYWKRRDPTPTTIYNEAMAEYFRRVDFSYTAFKTVDESDGAKSERGKIYILHGAPTEVNRDLALENSSKEIWIYRNSVNKQFVFERATNGKYRLRQILPL